MKLASVYSIILTASYVLTAMPAHANGDLFFLESPEHEHGLAVLGAVKDTTGKALPAVRITIILPGDVHFFAVTDSQGRFRCACLPQNVDPARARVSASLSGYQQVSAVNLTKAMRAGAPLEINFTMARRN